MGFDRASAIGRRSVRIFREVAEMAPAHTVGDKVEAAYRRGDLFQKRRQMMDGWAKFSGTVRPLAEVVPIGSRA